MGPRLGLLVQSPNSSRGLTWWRACRKGPTIQQRSQLSIAINSSRFALRHPSASCGQSLNGSVKIVQKARVLSDTASSLTRPESQAPLENSGQHIEVDNNTDSALGDDDGSSSTHSLESETQRWQFENGRRYHGFRQGTYHFPNDEGEAEREDMKHNVTLWLIGGRLHATEFSSPPNKVLDIGTGTGIWAIDFADDNPSSLVVAIDLSPIQPNLVPSNLEFQIDDIEDEWTFKEHSFNFVHCRYMASAIRDWPKLIRQSHHALGPGGRIELVDMDIEYTSDDNTVTEDNKLTKFLSDLRNAGPKLGINLSACKDFGSMLTEAGFTNVRTDAYKLPFGSWPKDRTLKEIGFLHREQFARGIQGIAYGLYGRGMKWSRDEIEVMLAGVRNDMMNRKIHGYWLVYFTTGELP